MANVQLRSVTGARFSDSDRKLRRGLEMRCDGQPWSVELIMSLCTEQVDPRRGRTSRGPGRAISLDVAGAWLHGARCSPSPNCDSRPTGNQIELLVVHGISLPPGRFGIRYIDDLFHNRLDVKADPCFAAIAELRVSAHALIGRDGAVIQYVPFPMRAWHAGRSHFEGREHCNDFSIGIELEGCDDVPYTDPQYRTLGYLCVLLMERWPAIGPDRLVGHCDIAPGRKTDPGPAFDWARLRQEVCALVRCDDSPSAWKGNSRVGCFR